MRRLGLLLLAGLVTAAPAAAQPFPTRSGELGVLDVPDAEIVGIGGSALAAELRVDRVAGQPIEGGPLPLSAVAGMGNDLDVGLYVREWGQPGDQRPARVVFGGRAKRQLVIPARTRPGLAVSAGVDRANGTAIVDTRVIGSTASLGGFRVLAFVGGEAQPRALSGLRPTYGAAVAAALSPRLTGMAEALGGPRGANLGAGLSWLLRPTMGLSVSANYFPGDAGLRMSVGFAYATAVRRAREDPPLVKAVAEEEDLPVARKATWEDRPRFRLRLALASPERLGEPRRLQHGPWTPRAVAGSVPAKPAGAAPMKASAPSLDDLAEAQLRDQESLADARERRVRATGEQLDARANAALEEAKKLERRESELAAREQQLDQREQRLPKAGPPSQQQRQLESLEAQLAAQERQLAAQDRSLAPAIEAAQGREREAAARGDAARDEASRLAATLSTAASRGAQLDVRKQVLGARGRQLAAHEARLVGKVERVDALERQLRAKGERLDAWSRRLDARAERLDLFEKRAEAAAKPKAAVPEPKPAEAKAPEPAPKDKAAFVMVVKSPTAILKERGGQGAPAAGAGIHAGIAVEKAVAAATVVTFPTPASQLSELDREAVENIARLAMKERCELLVWARAKDPTLVGEAQRRADELRARAIAVGLESSRVTTRTTTRPGAQGVDVVVSALREASKPAPITANPALLGGESGKRQVREALVAAQQSIEACVSAHVDPNKLQRAELSLQVTVSAQGRAVKLAVTGTDVAGEELERCLKSASRAWTFPDSDGDYVVDVPITIVHGGGAR